MNYYYLNDDNTYEPCSIKEWSNQAHKFYSTGGKHVGDDFIDGHRISTVWLGVDHNYFSDSAPLLFETMVFDKDKNSIYCELYSTWDEAEEGHIDALINLAKDACKDELS